MKSKRFVTKLTLKKETIACLDNQELGTVKGGLTYSEAMGCTFADTSCRGTICN